MAPVYYIAIPVIFQDCFVHRLVTTADKNTFFLAACFRAARNLYSVRPFFLIHNIKRIRLTTADIKIFRRYQQVSALRGISGSFPRYRKPWFHFREICRLQPFPPLKSPDTRSRLGGGRVLPPGAGKKSPDTRSRLPALLRLNRS